MRLDIVIILGRRASPESLFVSYWFFPHLIPGRIIWQQKAPAQGLPRGLTRPTTSLPVSPKRFAAWFSHPSGKSSWNLWRACAQQHQYPQRGTSLLTGRWMVSSRRSYCFPFAHSSKVTAPAACRPLQDTRRVCQAGRQRTGRTIIVHQCNEESTAVTVLQWSGQHSTA